MTPKTPARDVCARIKELSALEQVDIEEALQNEMLSGLESFSSMNKSAAQYDALRDTSFSHIWIGGYGDVFEGYGNGAGRRMHNADYALRTACIVPVHPLRAGRFRPKLSTELEGFIERCARVHQTEDQRFRRMNGSVHNPSTLVSGPAQFGEECRHLELMLANVKKHGAQYDGNVILYTVDQLGHGRKYISEDEIHSGESVRTLDILSGKSPIGERFRTAVKKQMSAAQNDMCTLAPVEGSLLIQMITVYNV